MQFSYQIFHVRPASILSKSTWIFFCKFSLFILYFFYLFFTIFTNPRSVSGSRIWLGGFWTCPDNKLRANPNIKFLTAMKPVVFKNVAKTYFSNSRQPAGWNKKPHQKVFHNLSNSVSFMVRNKKVMLN